MGKFIAIILIVYFCFYLYRRIKYRNYYKYKIYRKLKAREKNDVYNNNYISNDVIDVDNDEDEQQRPKYLH